LAAHGLTGRRRTGEFTEPESLRLRRALEELGPLFAGFGRYLGTRVDLLPLVDCSTLAETAIAIPAGPSPDRPPSIDGLDIEPEPVRRSYLHTWRRGRLADDTTVIVKTVRSEVVAAIEADIDILPVLESTHLEELSHIGAAAEDYLVWTERQLDLGRELTGLRQLAVETPHFDALLVPRLWEEYSDRDTLVYSDPAGEDPTESDDNRDDEEDAERARRLCSGWLQQALLESVLPEGPIVDNLRLMDDGRIAVTGGLFTSLAKKRRGGLLDAIVATSHGDPDEACEHLLRACDADLDEADHDRLQVLMRQAEPFRDRGWSGRYRGRRLGETLNVQWRLLRREGIDLPAPVVAFLCGLHQVDRCAQSMDRDHDALAEAVEDLSLVAATARLRETLSVSRLRGTLEAAVPVLRELLDRADHLATADSMADTPAKTSGYRQRREWTEIGGLLLIMVATVVAAHALGVAGVGGTWAQGLATGLFSVLAVTALWRSARGWRHGD
jgi:predicted unusual protein kinase regulating ubiquinone biosynthesis (AarF/ABC1/UbiB family)